LRCPCSFSGGAGAGAGTQCTRTTSSLTALESCSCSAGATRPPLIAPIVWRCKRCASVKARHESPAASALATASLWAASDEARGRENVGGGGADCFAPPHALRQRAAAAAAPSSRRLVRVFLRCKAQGPLILPARAERQAPREARARASRPASSRSDMRRGGSWQTCARSRAGARRPAGRRREAGRPSPG